MRMTCKTKESMLGRELCKYGRKVMEIVCIVLVVIDVVLIYENYALKMQNDKLITACKIMIDNTDELTKENREILDECEKVLLIEKETINHCKDIISFNKDLVKGCRNEVSK